MITITETKKVTNQLNKLESSKILVIIDPNVANPQQLAAGVISGAEVKILDAYRDGIIQITEILRENPNIATLHLVSHGSPGCIYLGNSELSLDTLPQYAAELTTWFSPSPHLPVSPSPRLKTPSLLLYGCNVAQSDAGAEFLGRLQQITQAKIQASSSKIGNSELGGNWQLDIAVGETSALNTAEIAFSLATQNAYAGIFVAPVANNDPFSAEFELSDLDGSNGFVINGIDVNYRSELSVSNAGDINADGIDDLIIGAWGAGNHSGESYVVFGSSNVGSSGTIELSDLDGNNGFVLHGIDQDDRSGKSVSNAGDINGDGIDDLIIGAPYAEANSERSGESYVVFGGSNIGSSGTFELSDLDGSNGFVLHGIDIFDSAVNHISGKSVSNAGDINGDGIDDLIIGAAYADPNGDSSGESYVIFGGSNVGSSGTVELSDLDGSNGFVINGIDESDHSGWSVSNAGDINEDGIDDIILGAWGADPNGERSGESYVVFGSSNVGSSGTVELSELDGSNGFVLHGIDELDNSGFSVSNAGDINADGIADLIIGAPAIRDTGESYVVFGDRNIGSSGTFELSALDGSNGFALQSIYGDEWSGWSVSNVGDVNGDGIDDIIIGSILASPNHLKSFAGESYVVFGGSNVGSSGTIEISGLDGRNGFVINGIDESDQSGWSVSNAGDINADGIDDLIIGTAFAEESYVVFGRGLISTDEDTPFTTSNVLTNDYDADGDSLTIIGINTTETKGLVINNGDGTFDYDPLNAFDYLSAGKSATDSFNYTISDGHGSFDSATVTITIHGMNDTLFGGAGADKLLAQNPYNTLFGRDGNDTLYGGISADQLHGQNDNDILDGGFGNDTLYGGAGADKLSGNEGNDSLFGGDGKDTLFGRAGADKLSGGKYNDSLVGGDGNDTLFGGAGADLLLGNQDDDKLTGSDGNDSLVGGYGNDTLNGGLGLDNLTGEAGSDRFALLSGVTADRDIILDYQEGVDFLKLTGSLTFDDLAIAQVGADTEIRETATNETLATLIGIDAGTIDSSDFV